MKEQETELMKKLAARAVVLAAKSFEVALDFTTESIGILEAVLECYHCGVKESEPPRKQLQEMALLWGAYLGETMLKCGGLEAGYNWGLSDGQPVLQNGGRWELTPVGKVEKRLLNGEADGVVSFYEIGMSIIKGKILA